MAVLPVTPFICSRWKPPLAMDSTLPRDESCSPVEYHGAVRRQAPASPGVSLNLCERFPSSLLSFTYPTSVPWVCHFLGLSALRTSSLRGEAHISPPQPDATRLQSRGGNPERTEDEGGRGRRAGYILSGVDNLWLTGCRLDASKVY